MKKGGKIVMCGFRKKLDKKIGAPDEFKMYVFFHGNIFFNYYSPLQYFCMCF